jgi:GNAT superfamily N-acetyltransferase
MRGPKDIVTGATLVEGYRPGILAEVVALHMEYYARHWSFGRSFEAKVAGDMAAFLDRLDPNRDLVLSVRDRGGALLGSITIQAPRAGPGADDEVAHLRWFIVGGAARGHGLGRSLLEHALEACDARGYALTYLTTFEGLHAARHLYESLGFRLVATMSVDQWNGGVVEQRFERQKGAGPTRA